MREDSTGDARRLAFRTRCRDATLAGMALSAPAYRLAIDVRDACGEAPTGKGMWTRRFVDELLARKRSVVLFTDRELPAAWAAMTEREPEHVRVERITARGIGWHLRAAARARHVADAYLSPTSYLVPRLLKCRMPVFPVVHDLIAFRDEPHDRKATLIERLTLGAVVRTARAVLTVSASTKADLLARYPRLDPARVVPIFAGPSWMAAPAPAAPSPDPVVVSIGTLSPRKNQLRLIEAFAGLPSPLRERARLVLVGGRGWHDGAIVAAATATPGVEWKGYLSDAECDALLGSASVLAFPSLYEGFGLPLLDAFSRGIPVLASDRGSLREVADGAAALCDPESVHSIATQLERLLTDLPLRDDLIRHGRERAATYSWPRTVDLALEAMDGFMAS